VLSRFVARVFLNGFEMVLVAPFLPVSLLLSHSTSLNFHCKLLS